MTNYTFSLLKPDAVRRGKVGPILGMLEPHFELRRLELIRPTLERVSNHYMAHEGRPYFEALVDFMRSGPVVALLLHTRHADIDAVASLRALMGPFRDGERRPHTIRGSFMVDGCKPYENLIHGSDAPEEVDRESSIWFVDAAFPVGA
jgi:nucleoside-diphosphate kinase